MLAKMYLRLILNWPHHQRRMKTIMMRKKEKMTMEMKKMTTTMKKKTVKKVKMIMAPKRKRSPIDN